MDFLEEGKNGYLLLTGDTLCMCIFSAHSPPCVSDQQVSESEWKSLCKMEWVWRVVKWGA